MLAGYDNRWITAGPDLSVSYSNLSPDEYRLRARVLDDRNEILSDVTFAFRIKNPWYKTWWAILLYIVLILLASAQLIGNHVRKIIRKKNQQFAELENHRLAQLDKQEKEITRLRNEKLEAELTHKSKELASATMMIINHTELLKNLRNAIQSLILNGKINRTEGKDLLKIIETDLSEEDEWNQFQDNFDLIHENFFRKLKIKFPALTPSDLKLCALLRLNYSSKEIGNMLNITIRGVEAARYRLRKKLALSETENLVEFMIKFQ
jgi:DNA-binding CsgD family transcriptional regulator